MEGLDQKLDFSFFVFHLGPEGGGTAGAEVFVLVSIGQDQEEAFADGDGPPAAGAEELAGLKLVVGGLTPGG
jgi:hypothetical protein